MGRAAPGASCPQPRHHAATAATATVGKQGTLNPGCNNHTSVRNLGKQSSKHAHKGVQHSSTQFLGKKEGEFVPFKIILIQLVKSM